MRTLTRRAQIATWLLLLSGLVLAGPNVQAQRPQVTAQLNSGIVRLGTSVRVNLRVQDVQNATVVDVPEVAGLKLSGISRPSREQRSSWINGRRRTSTSIRWVVVYETVQEGDFVIPPIEVEVDGERVKTRELALTVKRDLQGEELGMIEWVDLPERVFEGEPFRLRLRFGWDVRQRVNHANLILPWWGELANAIEAPDPSVKLANPMDVVLNTRSRITVSELGEQRSGDRTLRMFELDRRFVATRSGSIELPQSHLEFGMLQQSVFNERRDTKYVGLEATKIEVLPLPKEGQPYDFSGGVGRFYVTQDVDHRSLDVGESIKFGVEWSGAANLEFFEAPDPARVDAFEGFRVYGRTDEFLGNRRRVVYDIAPVRSDVTEIPALPLWVFDTEKGAYHSVDTEPIPIRVRALSGAGGLEGETSAGPVLDIGDVQTTPESGDGPRGPSDKALTFAPIGLFGAWFLLRSKVRRDGDPNAPAARAKRNALRQLQRELSGAQTATQQSLALRNFLGARSGESAEAWEGRSAEQWFADRASEDVQVSSALETLLRDLDQNIWAGEDRALERTRIESLAKQLVGGAL